MLIAVPQAANAVVISKTKSSPINNQVYLQPSVLNKFVVNPRILSNSFAPEAKQAYPFRQVQGQFAQLHYERVRINRGPEHAKKILEYFLQILDPNKVIFTKQEVDSFYAKYTTGSLPKLTNDLNVAWEIYRIYIERATALYRAQAEYILSVKDKQPNLDTNYQLLLDDKSSFRNANESIQDIAKKLALITLISVKLDKTNFTWSEICAYALRGLVNRQAVLNNTSNADVFNKFMNVYVIGGADTHSAFFPAEKQQVFTDNISRSFVGIGVSIKTNDDGTFQVVQVLPGGPAAKQGGIDKDDEIIAISQDNRNWQSVEGFTSDRVVSLIKGKANTKVYLRLLSTDGYTKVVSIVRGEVEKSDSIAKIKTYTSGGKKYGILSFSNFYLGVADDIRNLLNRNRDLSGLIIDLRGNGGGLVEELLKMSELFFGAYSPIFQVSSSPSQIVGNVKLSSPFNFGKKEQIFTQPIIVLVDELSASASEILSAAMQDYRRGIIVGRTTYGKGTVQAPNPISDFSNDGISLITIQKFFRLTGKATQFNGVTPDVILAEEKGFFQSERDSFNPLPYSVINETKFTPFTNYVNKTYISQLQNLETNWLNNNSDYRSYVNYTKRVVERSKLKVYNINYSANLAYNNSVHREVLNRYNAWARANGKKTFNSYRDLMNANLNEGPDPTLDLVKQMLVTYSKNFN
ncbi:carboxy terminal-processing peptidase [Psittacicella gerlachiana]|nr:carboxy terminal-processing peptidase [Psittacicella gerlachiana]